MQVKNAEIKEKPYKLSDSNGLFLLIKPNGSKYWRYKYRINQKEKTYAIGTAKDISLAEARALHQEARKQVLKGIDPSAQRQIRKNQSKLDAENSFESIAKSWFRTKLKQWDAKHAEKLWRSLELHVFPYIGSRSVKDIKPRDVLAVIQRIEKQGSTDLSHRVLQRISAVFQYAIYVDIGDYNPASDIKGALVPHQGRHFPAINGHEIPLFFSRLNDARTSDLNKLAIRLLAHTFVRQCELRRARWSEFDLNAAIWTVPAEHTKMKRIHLVPLARQALEIIDGIHAITGDSEYVFPSQNRQKNPIMSAGTITQVIKKMGYKDQMVGHGFRTVATTQLYEAGFSEDVVERQMQHMNKDRVRGAYDRALYLEPRTKMMQWWADYLDGVIRPADNVLTAAFGSRA